MTGQFTEEYIAQRRALLNEPDGARKFWEGEFKVNDDRGSGRTAAQLMELGPDDIYVVGHSREIDYAWHLLHHLRPHLLVKRSNFWSADFDPYRLRGLNLAVIVDHAAWERISDRTRAALYEYWALQDGRP